MPASCGFAKYLIVAVSDDLCYVFDKADGAFLGKVKNEETLGNDMHIEGMIKIDNNAFVIQYRTDMILNCNIKSDSHTEKLCSG
mgnify:FL=1